MLMDPGKDVEEGLKAALADRYRVEREIGSGGMATVYLAHDLRHNREVAVKVLRSELAAALGPDRFLREIRIAANLNHPHILPLFDSGEVDGFLYYVMPFEEGQSLREKLAVKGELPIAEAVRLLRDVVDALAHAHAKGVVHRDIKPDNVLLSGRHALVTDFGVAKAVSEATGLDKLTKVGVALGTPTYMAPEQGIGDVHVDHRADIYAVGVLAYELLTGRPPFLGTTPQMILSAHIVDTPEPVTKYREAVPPALEQMVRKCLEKKAADRWQSAEELLLQLEALATPSGGVTAIGTIPVAPAKRRWKAAAVAMAVVGVSAVIVAVNLIPRGSGVELNPNRVLVLPFENRTGDASLDQVGVMAADWLTEGLFALTGVVEPVPTEQVRQLIRARAEGSVAPGVNTEGLAEATGAGTLVSGSYYQRGDSLEFQAQVFNAIEGTILGGTEPVRGPVEDPGNAIGLLRERVTGILAARFDPLMQIEIPASVRPPSYEAFKAYSSGLSAWVDGDYAESLRHLERASALDTTYVRASILAISAYESLGQLAVAESLAVEAGKSSEGISPYDRLRLDLLLAGLRGDRAGVYRAVRAAAEMVPGGTTHWAAIGVAVGVNRPRAALEINGGLTFPEGVGRAPLFYWSGLASAHHMLGEHEEELAVAWRGRESWPSYLPTIAYEVRALAGLGKLAEIQDRIEECLTLRPERGWTPADVVRTAASELVVHGHPEVAQEVLRRAYEWHGSRASADAQSESGRFDLGQTEYLDRQLDEAERLFTGLAEESPLNVDYMGYLGAIAARRGDREGAERIADQLRDFEQPYIRGVHTLWRARIASLLGDEAAAVALLREALAQGREYGPGLHAELDFQPLWDFPPYQELMRPKG
jgi:tetratricopeptide (TPR) repeat protein